MAESEVLGNYQLLEPIGEDALGVIYKAHQASMNRTVTLRILPERLSKDPEYLARFTEQAQNAAACRSRGHLYRRSSPRGGRCARRPPSRT